MKDYLFPHKQGNKCPCKKANLSIKMRKNGTGPFVACTNYPDCDYIRGEVFPNENEEETSLSTETSTTREEEDDLEIPAFLRRQKN